MVELRYLSKKYIYTSLFFLVQRIQINVQLKEIHFITQFVFIATVISNGQRMKFQQTKMKLPSKCPPSSTVRNRVVATRKQYFFPFILKGIESSLIFFVHFWCKINFKEIVSLSRKRPFAASIETRLKAAGNEKKFRHNHLHYKCDTRYNLLRIQMGSKNFLNMLWKFLPQLVASPKEGCKKVIYQIYNNNCLLEGEHCTIRK